MSTNKNIEMSKSNGVLKIKQINIDDLDFGEISLNKNGGKFTNLQLNGNPFKIQMPNLKTWGIKCYEDQNNPNQPPKYSLNLVFTKENVETDSKIKEALQHLEKMEIKVKEMLKDRSKEFFNKKSASMDFIDACFTPFVSKSKDKETQEEDDRYSSIKTKLNLFKDKETGQLTEKFMAKLFTKTKEKLVNKEGNEITTQNYHCFSAGTEAKCVIQPGMVWFIGNKCGLTWNLHQGMVGSLNERSNDDLCIVLDSSDDEADTTDGDSSDEDETDDK